MRCQSDTRLLPSVHLPGELVAALLDLQLRKQVCHLALHLGHIARAGCIQAPAPGEGRGLSFALCFHEGTQTCIGTAEKEAARSRELDVFSAFTVSPCQTWMSSTQPDAVAHRLSSEAIAPLARL